MEPGTDLPPSWTRPPKAPYVPLPEPTAKFVALSLATFGIYPVVWFYRQWKYFNTKYDMGVSPLLRAVFAYFFIYPLFKTIKEDLARRGAETGFIPAVTAFLFFLVSISGKLPQPWFMIGILSFAPLLPVHAASNALLALEPSNQDRRAGMGGWEWIILFTCGTLLLVISLVVFGGIEVPAPPPAP